MLPSSSGDYPAARVLLSIVGFTAAVVLLAAMVASFRPPAPPNEVSFRDLTDASFVEIRTADGEVVMSGELKDRPNNLGGVEKDAALLGRGFQRVIGEIEIEIPRPGTANPSQELEVDVISLQPRREYHVVVNDHLVARFTTDDRGSIDVEFNYPVASDAPAR